MADKTTIEWTEATFNPWWGCTKVSPGCDHCYAERDSARFAPGLWGVEGGRRLFSESHWNQPFTWNARAQKAGKRKRVFCASMADVFDNHHAVTGQRERLWRVIEETPMLDWQILTKRVGNVAKMVPPTWMLAGFPPNVWMGISVVNQDEFDRDVPKLLELPARVRWLSCEPLLGPIDIRITHAPMLDSYVPLDWIVVGGESGPRARPMHPGWARSLRDQCVLAGIPFLFKQWGEWAPGENAGGPLLRTEQAAWWLAGKWDMQPVTAREAESMHRDDSPDLWRCGKKNAGRMLDGRTWDQYPVRHIAT